MKLSNILSVVTFIFLLIGLSSTSLAGVEPTPFHPDGAANRLNFVEGFAFLTL